MFERDADSLMALLLDFEIVSESESDKVEPRAPRAELRENLLAAIADTALGSHPFPGFRRRFARLFAFSEEQAEEVLRKMDDPEAWLPLGAVSFYHFEPGAQLEGAHAGIVRCQSGSAFPEHRHLGEETTLILSGCIQDDDTGALFLPGDVVTAPEGTVHHLRIPTPHDCVFAVLMAGGFPDFD